MLRLLAFTFSMTLWNGINSQVVNKRSVLERNDDITTLFIMEHEVRVDSINRPAPLWGDLLFDDQPFYHNLDENCPVRYRWPPGLPVYMKRKLKPRTQYVCMKLIPPDELGAVQFGCETYTFDGDGPCDVAKVAEAITDTFPTELKQTLKEEYDLTVEMLNWLLASSMLNRPEERRIQVSWFGKPFEDGRLVCWPKYPGFGPADYEDIWGFLGALFVNPETKLDAAPERFMDYPPGYINRTRFHNIEWQSYQAPRLDAVIGTSLLNLGRDKSAYALRWAVDRWAGHIGRVLFSAMYQDGAYKCPDDITCVKDTVTSCDAPIAPAGARGLLNVFRSALHQRLPFVVSWDEACERRPYGIWVAVTHNAAVHCPNAWELGYH
ncbi:hypothetical protein CDD82_2833 [Ophiocordyceps australis]|uniref:Uncharacterized protein n=1 Tax=Ophiocordyceps australis TaxID=1399860 RepID=A0A2C5ZFM0_9HYPO|nr:hypothetical protein CDD82_2833 [Ophiocordyceps australis]